MSALTVLIVDDHSIDRKQLRAQIEAEGETALEAANGVEALSILERHGVDAVISDILMPGMDGYRLCYEVRSSDRFRDVPFLIYTAGDVTPSEAKLALDLGADEIVRKPASAGALLRAVRECLTRPRPPPAAVFGIKDVLEQQRERHLLMEDLERKNTELSEAVSELTLLTTALETAADAILITDREGVIRWVNRAFTATTGYTPEEALGRTPRILKSGAHDESFYKAFWETILSGRTWRSEFTNRRKDGSISHDVHTVTPVRSAGGAITHFVGVMHDVTARKLAEDRLREAHHQLREILDHSPAVVYALSLKGEEIVPTLVSENVTRLLGFEVKETLGLEWWRTNLHPEDRERAEASIAETLEHGSSRIEYRLRQKDGGFRWVDDHCRVVRDAEGKAVQMVGVWTDVTERKHAEEALHESERRFREMLNNLDLVAMMLDREGRITYCNDYFLRLTRWRRDEVLGRNWFERFIPPEQVEKMQMVFETLLDDESAHWHNTNEILTRSGDRRLLQWYNSPLRSPSGEVIGTASVGDDITDRVAHQKQMLRAQRLESLGTLAGGIAHDLNNVLMPVLMGVTLLKRLDPDERSQKALDNIERAVTRGRDLVKQVLLFARGSDRSLEAVQIADIVKEVESIAGSMFPSDIRLEVSIARNLRPITGDPTNLTQVLLNLCVNARDAMPDGGVVAISAMNAQVPDQLARSYGAAAGGPHVVLKVSDSGEGMSREVIERIFDPFFTTKEIGKGTGLGLSTVQGIVSSHGGFITVSSRLGEGSTFEVYFPVRLAKAQTLAEEEAEPIPEGNDELILVADDDAAVLGITKQALESFGYRTLTAEDGAQAIGLYAHHRGEIALVLTDMAMPVIDGPALIAALHRINPAARIMVMTGGMLPAHLSELTSEGTETLTKPFTANQLLRAVHDALSRNKGRVPEAPLRS